MKSLPLPIEGGPNTEPNKLEEEDDEDDGFGPKRSATMEAAVEEDEELPTCFEGERIL